jgi:hypothetical protein
MPTSIPPASGSKKKTPLFRSAAGRHGGLTATAMTRVDAWRLIQRRAAELGMKGRDRLPHISRNGNHRLR